VREFNEFIFVCMLVARHGCFLIRHRAKLLFSTSLWAATRYGTLSPILSIIIIIILIVSYNPTAVGRWSQQGYLVLVLARVGSDGHTPHRIRRRRIL
jgi:hypothetical protein